MKTIKCPICNSVINESSICPVCKTELEVNPNNKLNWVKLLEVPTEIEATHIKNIFKDADIPVVIYSNSNTMYVFTVGSMASFIIKVPDVYLYEGLEILKSMGYDIS